MAKNEKTPAERAQYSYDTKKEYDKLYTPKDRAKDRYKVNKEYRKLEKRDKLPSFIITIIVFVLFIGVFTGLYTQYDYELELKPKEFTEINIVESSEVISAKLENSFVDFFIALSDITNLASKGTSYLSNYSSVSDNPEIDTYLKRLQADSKVYLKNNYGFLKRLTLTQELGYYIDSFGNPDVFYTVKGLEPGVVHSAYAHNRNLEDIAAMFGWNSDVVHAKFLDFNICHVYHGEFYHYCNYK